MARFNDYTAAEFQLGQDTRSALVQQLQEDLVQSARNIGQTDEQIDTRLDELFGTFSGDWSLFILTGSDVIATSIQNDTTLNWLDLSVGAKTVRERLIERLQQA